MIALETCNPVVCVPTIEGDPRLPKLGRFVAILAAAVVRGQFMPNKSLAIEFRYRRPDSVGIPLFSDVVNTG
jgi:hypothetical protein